MSKIDLLFQQAESSPSIQAAASAAWILDPCRLVAGPDVEDFVPATPMSSLPATQGPRQQHELSK